MEMPNSRLKGRKRNHAGTLIEMVCRPWQNSAHDNLVGRAAAASRQRFLLSLSLIRRLLTFKVWRRFFFFLSFSDFECFDLSR